MCKNVFLDDDREGTVLTKYVTNIRVIAGNVMAYIKICKLGSIEPCFSKTYSKSQHRIC